MKLKRMSLSGLPRQSLFLIVISSFLPLLFTSCLADMLNEKFGYTPPITISYTSDHAKNPRSKTVASGKALTTEELPELSEQGYIFDGWYLDQNWTTKINEGDSLEENTTLYAKWTPRTDTPFTVEHYFYNLRNGDTGYSIRSEKTQHLTGTTGSYVDQSSYDLRYANPGNTEFENYSIVPYDATPSYKEDGYGYIKGDGSTVIKIYYYMNRIYDYEFATLLNFLWDTISNGVYYITFTQDPSKGFFDYSAIRNLLNQKCEIKSTYYDEYFKREKSMYNKRFSFTFDLNISYFPAEAFCDTKGLNSVTLPYTCTTIRSKAFYNCEDLDFVNTTTHSNGLTGSWKSYDSNGYNSTIKDALMPDSRDFADLLRTTTYEYRYE